MAHPSKIPTAKQRAESAFKWVQSQSQLWGLCNRSFATLQGKVPLDPDRARKFLVNNARDIERGYDLAHSTPLGMMGVWELSGLLLEHFQSGAWCKCEHPSPQRQSDEYFCGHCGARWEA